MRVPLTRALFIGATALATGCALIGGFDFDGLSAPSDASVLPDGESADADLLDAPAASDGAVVDTGPDAAIDQDSGVPGVCDESIPKCTVAPQCGCPGRTCEEINVNQTVCRDAGPTGQDLRCFSPYDCAQGLTCWQGVCKRYCSQLGQTCANGGACIHPAKNSVVYGTMLCATPCSLVDAAACGAFTACDFGGNGDVDCQRSANAVGATYPWQCMAGTRTVYDASDTIWDCEKWCRLGDAGDCPAGKTCTAARINPDLGSAVVVNGVSYGACL